MNPDLVKEIVMCLCDTLKVILNFINFIFNINFIYKYH